MQKKISVWTAVMICALAVILSSMGTVLVLRGSYNAKLYSNISEYNKKLAAIEEQMEEYGEIAADIRQIDELYRQMYPGVLDAEELRDGAIKGYVAGSGDKYGFYYSPEEAEALMDSVNGETDGIGVSVIYDAEVGCIEIISVYGDSPAESAGIRTGDYIAYVIGEDGERKAVAEIGYEAAVNMLRGDAGTKAEFVVLRDDNGDGVYDEINFIVEREHIESESVSFHIYELDASIGVVRMTGFDKNTPAQFFAAIESLRADGAEKLIFDVRYNPGGDKDSVCEILDYLLPEGPLMRTVDAEGNYTVIETSDESFLDMPMAVVMNSGTASAGELFAAAIKDYGAGKLVGEKTYGKGSMQSIISVFDDGSLLKLTVDMYCPPYSENYDGEGVYPDIEEPLDEALLEKSFYKYTDAEDNQLRAAAASFE